VLRAPYLAVLRMHYVLALGLLGIVLFVAAGYLLPIAIYASSYSESTYLDTDLWVFSFGAGVILAALATFYWMYLQFRDQRLLPCTVGRKLWYMGLLCSGLILLFNIGPWIMTFLYEQRATNFPHERITFYPIFNGFDLILFYLVPCLTFAALLNIGRAAKIGELLIFFIAIVAAIALLLFMGALEWISVRFLMYFAVTIYLFCLVVVLLVPRRRASTRPLIFAMLLVQVTVPFLLWMGMFTFFEDPRNYALLAWALIIFSYFVITVLTEKSVSHLRALPR
jgi:hypothetical protein